MNGCLFLHFLRTGYLFSMVVNIKHSTFNYEEILCHSFPKASVRSLQMYLVQPPRHCWNPFRGVQWTSMWMLRGMGAHHLHKAASLTVGNLYLKLIIPYWSLLFSWSIQNKMNLSSIEPPFPEALIRASGSLSLSLQSWSLVCQHLP